LPLSVMLNSDSQAKQFEQITHAMSTDNFLSRDSLFNDYLVKYGYDKRPEQPTLGEYVMLRMNINAEAVANGWIPVDTAKPEQHMSKTGISYSKMVEVLSRGEVKAVVMQAGEFSDRLKVTHWRYIQPATEIAVEAKS